MTNIIDGMDAARFKSVNSEEQTKHDKKRKQNKADMPTVLKNLKNGS
ncbi:hypothetical protein [Halalkalibacter urbisdiaboli]|nr:hypothetical protein [Halalkalibacter urbisdiaboli]